MKKLFLYTLLAVTTLNIYAGPNVSKPQEIVAYDVDAYRQQPIFDVTDDEKNLLKKMSKNFNKYAVNFFGQTNVTMQDSHERIVVSSIALICKEMRNIDESKNEDETNQSKLNEARQTINEETLRDLMFTEEMFAPHKNSKQWEVSVCCETFLTTMIINDRVRQIKTMEENFAAVQEMKRD